MRPSEALEKAIEKIMFDVLRVKNIPKKPGQIIEKCEYDVRAALQRLTDENMGTPREDVLKLFCENEKWYNNLLLEFDKKILKNRDNK